MDIQYYTKKGIHLDTIELVCIYKETIKGNQQNDKYRVTLNKIFAIILQAECHLAEVPFTLAQ